MVVAPQIVEKVVIPEDNKPDLYDIDETVKNAVEFIAVSKLDELFDVALYNKVESVEANVRFSPHDIVLKDRRDTDEIR